MKFCFYRRFCIMLFLFLGGCWFVAPLLAQKRDSISTRIERFEGYKLTPEMSIGICPGYNVHDGLMIGGLLVNRLPVAGLEVMALPYYGLDSKSLVGMVGIRQSVSTSAERGFVGNVFEVWGQSFSKKTVNLDSLQYREKYISFKASSTAHFRWAQKHLLVGLEAIFNDEEKGIFENRTFKGVGYGQKSLALRLRGRYEIVDSIAPKVAELLLEQGEYQGFPDKERFLKLALSYKQRIPYGIEGKHACYLRFFASGFLSHTDRQFGAMPLLAAPGTTGDWWYDGLFLGRNQSPDANGILSQQIQPGQGGLRTPLPKVLGLGQSNNMLIAVNLESDIPMQFIIKAPGIVRLRPYLDVAYCPNTQPTATGLSPYYLSGGFSLQFLDRMFSIYCPVFSSENITNAQKQNGMTYGQTIGFQLQLQRLVPLLKGKNRVGELAYF